MKHLDFETASQLHHGRRVRRPRFGERSSLPVSAACLAANGVREALSALFGTALQTRVLEPAIPGPSTWDELLREAYVFSVRGGLGDGAVILRQADARALVAAAFGEGNPAQRVLSRIERTVLTRLVSAVAPTLAAVCGVDVELIGESQAPIGSFTTYFEVLIDRGVRARIGVALARDPRVESHGALRLEDLGEVPLALQVCLGKMRLTGAQLLDIRRGTTLPIPGVIGTRGTLMLGSRALARGECGVRGGRYALRVGQPLHG